jgi:hypothetical protein
MPMKKIQKVMKSGKTGRPAERKGIEMHSNTMASCNKSQTNCKLFNNTFMGFVRVLLILIYLAIMNGCSSWLF